MVEIKDRQLNFGESLLISEMLRTIGAKAYVEYMMRQTEKARKDLEKAKKDKSLTEAEIKVMDALSKKNLGVDVAMYIIERLDQAKEPIYKLVSSYASINIKDVPLLDLDDIIGIFQSIWSNGLPNILKKFLGLDKNFLA